MGGPTGCGLIRQFRWADGSNYPVITGMQCSTGYSEPGLWFCKWPVVNISGHNANLLLLIHRQHNLKRCSNFLPVLAHCEVRRLGSWAAAALAAPPADSLAPPQSRQQGCTLHKWRLHLHTCHQFLVGLGALQGLQQGLGDGVVAACRRALLILATASTLVILLLATYILHTNTSSAAGKFKHL